jgi:aminoglycoside 6'-N-acetyltransferase
MPITLRPATRADIPLLEAWGEDADVHASSPNDDWDWAGQTLVTEGLENLIAELDGRAIGYIQITDLARDASHYWGPHQQGLMAIDIEIGEPDMRGHGHGRAMMGLALARCFSDPTIEAVLIDPLTTNTRAIAFYRRLGFTFLENRWFDQDHCAVHILKRETYEQGNLP